MKFSLLIALYGGPDQLMPLTSGLTAIFAFLLIFWNKVTGVVGKLLNSFRRTQSAHPKDETLPSTAAVNPETVEQSHPEITQ